MATIANDRVSPAHEEKACDLVANFLLSYDIATGSEITPCNKIDKLLVVYRFLGNVL